MKFKKILILVISLFLTGCSVEYNLNIDDIKASESIYAYFENNEENTKLVKRLEKMDTAAFYNNDIAKDNYYNVESGEKNNMLYVKYNYNYFLNDLQKSNAINECFYNKSIFKDKKYITINTNKGLSCVYHDQELQVEKLVVNINTKYDVVETNADIVDGYKYTWKFNLDNYNEKSIFMKIDYTKEKKVQSKAVENEINIAIFLVIFMIISIALIFYFKFRSRKKY